MGPLAYPHYYFLNMVDRGRRRPRAQEQLPRHVRPLHDADRSAPTWAGSSLVAHEYFHNWNVKRLRPVELGPFDYENENYVKTLWVAEGFTDYYADVLRAAAPASVDARRVPRRAVGPDRGGADAPGPPGDAGGHGVVRHLDQAVPPRREHRRTRPSTTTRRARSSRSCSTRKIRKATNGAQLARRRRCSRRMQRYSRRQGLHARAVLRR